MRGVAAAPSHPAGSTPVIRFIAFVDHRQWIPIAERSTRSVPVRLLSTADRGYPPAMNTSHRPTQDSAHRVASLLQPVLVDLIALTLNAKQAHWHVRGRQFTQVHEQLDELVRDTRRFSDEVAERVVALGVEMDGRPEIVSREANVPETPQGFLPDDKVVVTTVEQLDAVIERTRKTLQPLDDIDLTTQDIIIELVRSLEKHRWMFEAQVTG